MKHPASAARLARVGEALFGRMWQAALPGVLGTSKRQVQRWAAGEYPVRVEAWRRLYAEGAQRQKALAAVMKELEPL